MKPRSPALAYSSPRKTNERFLPPSVPLIHPAFRVSHRFSRRNEWEELPVYAMAVDMRRPRLVGQVILPSTRHAFLRITTLAPYAHVQLLPRSPGSLRKAVDGSLRITLRPQEIKTLKFDRDPGFCLHLISRPPRLAKSPASNPRLLRFRPGVHAVPGGVLRLESGQTLHLDPGAVLRARLECKGVENVTIRGLGIIDLLPNCPRDPSDEQAPKEQALSIKNSRNIRVEGLTFRNPSHYGILLGQSRDVHISNVSIFTHCKWGDGIDSMSCSDLRVEHSFIRTSDDCLAVYADRWAFKGNVRRHHYHHCTLWADVAHPVMIGVHGKQTSPGRVLEDLRFEHMTVLRHCEPHPMYQGCLAINPGDLNTVRNVHFSSIRIEDPEAPRLLDLRVLFNPDFNPVPGKAIEKIRFHNLDFRGNPRIPSVFEGHDRQRRVRDVRVHSLRINGKLQKELQKLQLNDWAETPVVS